MCARPRSPPSGRGCGWTWVGARSAGLTIFETGKDGQARRSALRRLVVRPDPLCGSRGRLSGRQPAPPVWTQSHGPSIVRGGRANAALPSPAARLAPPGTLSPAGARERGTRPVAPPGGGGRVLPPGGSTDPAGRARVQVRTTLRIGHPGTAGPVTPPAQAPRPALASDRSGRAPPADRMSEGWHRIGKMSRTIFLFSRCRQSSSCHPLTVLFSCQPIFLPAHRPHPASLQRSSW